MRTILYRVAQQVRHDLFQPSRITQHTHGRVGLHDLQLVLRRILSQGQAEFFDASRDQLPQIQGLALHHELPTLQA